MAEQRGTVGRVALDDVELARRVSGAALRRIAVGHLQLADVVQQRGDREGAQPLAAQTELPADLDGELGDASRVLARRGVLDREPGEQARDPGAEQLLLLGDDVVDVDVGEQRATASRARDRSRAPPKMTRNAPSSRTCPAQKPTDQVGLSR